MEVTNEMIMAAIKQAVKDDLIPAYASQDSYIHNCECMKRIIEKALEAA